jgi:hypothetical protein
MDYNPAPSFTWHFDKQMKSKIVLPIEPKLVAAYNAKQQIDIGKEQRKLERERRISSVLFLIGIFCVFPGMIGGLSLGMQFSSFCEHNFGMTEDSLLSVLISGIFLPGVITALVPCFILLKFVPVFSKDHGVVISEFRKHVDAFREHYYTGSPDVILTEELIRNNLVLMARRVLLEKSVLDLLENSGWASEKACNETRKIYLEAVQTLDNALISMSQFNLTYSKQAIFAQAKNP